MAPKRALLVGVSYAGTDYHLKGCIPDVVKLNAYLLEIGVAHVKVLRDDLYSPGEPFYPSRSNVLRALTELLRHGDDCYVHFSGHGFSVNEKNAMTTKGRTIAPETRECLLLHSNLTPSIKDIEAVNTVCDEQIVQLFSLLSRTARAILTIDACAAGTMFDFPFNLQVRSHTADEVTYTLRKVPARGRVINHPGVICFTAVRHHKYSWDVTGDGGEVYGLFTFTLVKILRAARKQNQALTPLDLLALLDVVLQQSSKPDTRQDPQLSIVDREACTQPLFLT